jgi:hypothetical protein
MASTTSRRLDRFSEKHIGNRERFSMTAAGGEELRNGL